MPQPYKYRPNTNGLKRLWKLKPSSKLCTDFYVLDVETGIEKDDGYIYWCLDARPKRFKFGVLYGYNYCRVIYSVKEFKEILLEPRFKNKKIFAHNGGRYDFLVLYGNIYQNLLDVIFNGKFICASNGNCILADSTNVFVGASVHTIGKMMGLHKGTLGETGYRSKGITAKDINYCIRDCQIIWDALVSVFEFAGEIKITQASLSMTYYRRFHQPFHIDHNENTKFFWESYYGGRCEVFKRGKTHAKVIDVNSMYPAQMKNLTFPNPKILKHEKEISVSRFLKYLYWYEGMAYIDVFHYDHKYGFLPVKSDGKLIFPVGDISGKWNFNEIRFALEQGIIEIKKIHYTIYSEPMPSPFVSYVDTLQRLKLEAEISGNEFERDRAKRFSNSLYGKFAQRITEESIYLPDIEKCWEKIVEAQQKNIFLKLIPFNKKRNDAFLILKSGKKMDISYSIPSFASYITSGGRVQLLKKLLECEINVPLYCDTDGIFIQNDLGIKSSKALGEWKLENKIVTEIITLKNYRYIDIDKSENEIWRVKGVPVIKIDEKTKKPRTTKIFDENTLEETEVPTVEQIGENKFRYFNLIQTKEALRRNKEPGVITERIKEIKNKYDKRIILLNGETKPIKL